MTPIETTQRRTTLRHLPFVGLMCACLLYFSGPAFGADEPQLSELVWVDKGYLSGQREIVDDIGRREFGTRVRGDKSDLRLLQRILDNGLVNQTELVKQQALGVVLGDIYVNELNLQWRVYLDREGKSRAVCMPETSHCLFPITMISKRASLGAKVDVAHLYDRGVSFLEAHIPKLPYSARK